MKKKIERIKPQKSFFNQIKTEPIKKERKNCTIMKKAKKNKEKIDQLIDEWMDWYYHHHFPNHFLQFSLLFWKYKRRDKWYEKWWQSIRLLTPHYITRIQDTGKSNEIKPRKLERKKIRWKREKESGETTKKSFIIIKKKKYIYIRKILSIKSIYENINRNRSLNRAIVGSFVETQNRLYDQVKLSSIK